MLKEPGRICLKSCQEAERRAEWSVLHVGIAGKDSFLNGSQRHFCCLLGFLPCCNSFVINCR